MKHVYIRAFITFFALFCFAIAGNAQLTVASSGETNTRCTVRFEGVITGNQKLIIQ
jgi:hypothetical protein